MLLEADFLKQMSLLIVQKEKMTADEVFFLLLNLQKKLDLIIIDEVVKN